MNEEKRSSIRKPYSRELCIFNTANEPGAICSLRIDENGRTISLSIDNRQCSEDFIYRIDEKFALLCEEFKKEETMKTIVRFEMKDLEEMIAPYLPGKRIVKLNWLIDKAMDQRERNYVACEVEVEELPKKER